MLLGIARCFGVENCLWWRCSTQFRKNWSFDWPSWFKNRIWVAAIDLRSELDTELYTVLCCDNPATASSDEKYCDCSWWSRQIQTGNNRLTKIGWTDKETRCVLDLREAIRMQYRWPHPRKDTTICVCTHASESYWGAMNTLLSVDQTMLSLADMEHQALVFLVGQ